MTQLRGSVRASHPTILGSNLRTAGQTKKCLEGSRHISVFVDCSAGHDAELFCSTSQVASTR